VNWSAPAPTWDLLYFENGYPDLEAHEALAIDANFSWDDGTCEGNASPLAADARVSVAHLPSLEVLMWTLGHEERIFPVEGRIRRLRDATRVMTCLPTSQEPPNAKFYPDVERDAGWAPSIQSSGYVIRAPRRGFTFFECSVGHGAPLMDCEARHQQTVT
jgi:hypothetical protein